jgi:hypothetical protein
LFPLQITQKFIIALTKQLLNGPAVGEENGMKEEPALGDCAAKADAFTAVLSVELSYHDTETLPYRSCSGLGVSTRRLLSSSESAALLSIWFKP